eukprot:CAMPEP_0206325354 /NCGR_PEP_ID=MMETSP0106_2-20121207/21028_1 /ASSEMBLY_ACC=CAM_ASM_000206 /TAXON_ID=81532 /ORGANISM="Acanthoeca-like sp., Strain 10tr" /LENGTH=57 /DNA_ID=CAMNT_0053757815 /DNA_START=134 /DNA_END=304 /DNA_ORIENTATION=+
MEGGGWKVLGVAVVITLSVGLLWDAVATGPTSRASAAGGGVRTVVDFSPSAVGGTTN